MKNLTKTQILNINKLHAWDSTNFHGNRKTYKGFPVELAKKIITKRYIREISRFKVESKQSNLVLAKDIIKRAIDTKGTNYFKILIEGNTGIYLASPEYLHSDYNKSRLFDKNEKTLKIMEIVNKIIAK
jgi:hypothetical protein